MRSHKKILSRCNITYKTSIMNSKNNKQPSRKVYGFKRIKICRRSRATYRKTIDGSGVLI